MRGDDHRVLLVGQPDLLEPLGQAADRDVDDAELVASPPGRPRPAAGRRRRPRARARRRTCAAGRSRGRPASGRSSVSTSVDRACSSSSRRNRRVITSCIDATSFCPSTPLITKRRYSLLRGQPVLEDDHAGHHLGALEVGDVVALDAQRRLVEAERLLDLLQRLVAGGQVGAALGLVHHQRLAGVAGHGLLQRPLVAALRHPDPDPAPPALGRAAPRTSRARAAAPAPGSRAGSTSSSSAPA